MVLAAELDEVSQDRSSEFQVLVLAAVGTKICERLSAPMSVCLKLCFSDGVFGVVTMECFYIHDLGVEVVDCEVNCQTRFHFGLDKAPLFFTSAPQIAPSFSPLHSDFHWTLYRMSQFRAKLYYKATAMFLEVTHSCKSI